MVAIRHFYSIFDGGVAISARPSGRSRSSGPDVRYGRDLTLP
jgi:hypothetical protein